MGLGQCTVFDTKVPGRTIAVREIGLHQLFSGKGKN